MKKKNTVFITSSYRSGGALFTKMLNVNDKIKVSSGTVNFFRYYFKKNKSIKKKINYQSYLNQFCIRLKYRFGINLDYNAIIKQVEKKNFDYSDLYRLMCSKIFKNKKFTIVGEHAGNEWRNISNYLKIFPKGKAIILLRDPRDIICSFKKITIAKKNDYLISIFNFIDLINYTYALKKKHDKKIHIVKFHELKKNPKIVIKRVCKFLNVKYNYKMINERYYKGIDGKKWDQSKVFSFSGKLKKQNVDRWKSIIEMEDLFLCEFLANKQMKMMGLERSSITFDKKIISKGFNRITSSNLLTESFMRWILSKEGNNKYPLDPTDPKNYDMTEFKNPKIFKIKYKQLTN
jgi:hypothetical protein